MEQTTTKIKTKALLVRTKSEGGWAEACLGCTGRQVGLDVMDNC